jgi:hypothetical protein
VVAAWPDGAVRVARGRGGVVVRVHAEAWSLVFRVGGRVLVALERMPGTLWRIDRDRDWAPDVAAMVDGWWPSWTAAPGRGPLPGPLIRATTRPARHRRTHVRITLTTDTPGTTNGVVASIHSDAGDDPATPQLPSGGTMPNDLEILATNRGDVLLSPIAATDVHDR